MSSPERETGLGLPHGDQNSAEADDAFVGSPEAAVSVTPASNRERTSKSAWFAEYEDVTLFKSYLNISTSSTVGTGRKWDEFWNEVATAYQSTIQTTSQAKISAPPERTPKQLSNRFASVNSLVTAFNSYYVKEKNNARSGSNQSDWHEAAEALFSRLHAKGKTPRKWQHEKVWQLLQEHPRWFLVTSSDGLGPKPGKRQRIVEIADRRDDVFDNGSETPRKECSDDLERPPGSKRAKRTLTEEKTYDRAIALQAQASDRMAASMESRNALMQEAAEQQLMLHNPQSLTSTATIWLEIKQRRVLERLQLSTDGQINASPLPSVLLGSPHGPQAHLDLISPPSNVLSSSLPGSSLATVNDENHFDAFQ